MRDKEIVEDKKKDLYTVASAIVKFIEKSEGTNSAASTESAVKPDSAKSR